MTQQVGKSIAHRQLRCFPNRVFRQIKMVLLKGWVAQTEVTIAMYYVLR